MSNQMIWSERIVVKYKWEKSSSIPIYSNWHIWALLGERKVLTHSTNKHKAYWEPAKRIQWLMRPKSLFCLFVCSPENQCLRYNDTFSTYIHHGWTEIACKSLNHEVKESNKTVLKESGFFCKERQWDQRTSHTQILVDVICLATQWQWLQLSGQQMRACAGLIPWHEMHCGWNSFEYIVRPGGQGGVYYVMLF